MLTHIWLPLLQDRSNQDLYCLSFHQVFCEMGKNMMYPLEVSQSGTSNKYLQKMFCVEIR